MNTARHRTWDRALVAWAVRCDAAKAARAAGVAMLVVGIGAGLLPGVAQAHEYGPVGVNGAQLYVSPDGYDQQYTHGFAGGHHLSVAVTGKGFKAQDVAQVFQCEEGAVNLHTECQLIGTGATSLKGDLILPNLYVRSSFAGPDTGELRRCRGETTMVQCAVVAATFDSDLQPTSRAEHFICFFGPNEIHQCKDRPTGPSPTIPPKAGNLTMAVDGYDGYYPGERLTTMFGETTHVTVANPVFGGCLPVICGVDHQAFPYTAPINVEGQDFRPDDVVELFQCRAGENRDLHAYCLPLGTAPSSPDGEFSATVSLRVMDQVQPRVPLALYPSTFQCRGFGEDQCSVIAATFDHADPGVQYSVINGGNIHPTSKAENYVCFEGPNPCANKPGAPVETTTTTTTVLPPPITHNVADFDANGSTDVSVFRPSSGTWYVKDGLSTNWGTEGDIAVPADYDGNGSADVAVFRPSNGVWFVQGGASAAYGTEGDIPVPGDYDGNGSAEFAVFRPSSGTWFVNGGITANWGTSGDIPVPGDYTGDGATDIAVFRPSTNAWFVKDGITATFGAEGDIPVPADYDADASETTEVAVFRPSTGTWFVYGQGAFNYGTSGDVPVPGHYDVDPFVDIAVFRPSTGTWFIDGGPAQGWGTSGDVALPLAPAVYHSFF